MFGYVLSRFFKQYKTGCALVIILIFAYLIWTGRPPLGTCRRIHVSPYGEKNLPGSSSIVMTTTPFSFGDSRTHVGSRHALIAPDGHIPSRLPDIDKATVVVLISREMGARLTQLLLTFQADGTAVFRPMTPRLSRTSCAVRARGSFRESLSFEMGSYLFVPAGQVWNLSAPSEGTQLNLFFKKYVHLDGAVPPEVSRGTRAR